MVMWCVRSLLARQCCLSVNNNSLLFPLYWTRTFAPHPRTNMMYVHHEITRAWQYTHLVSRPHVWHLIPTPGASSPRLVPHPPTWCLVPPPGALSPHLVISWSAYNSLWLYVATGSQPASQQFAYSVAAKVDQQLWGLRFTPAFFLSRFSCSPSPATFGTIHLLHSER